MLIKEAWEKITETLIITPWQVAILFVCCLVGAYALGEYDRPTSEEAIIADAADKCEDYCTWHYKELLDPKHWIKGNQCWCSWVQTEGGNKQVLRQGFKLPNFDEIK